MKANRRTWKTIASLVVLAVAVVWICVAGTIEKQLGIAAGALIIIGVLNLKRHPEESEFQRHHQQEVGSRRKVKRHFPNYKSPERIRPPVDLSGNVLERIDPKKRARIMRRMA